MEERTVQIQPGSPDGKPQQVVAEVTLQNKFDKFEEYKLFIEDTARFSERRQLVTNIYIAVNGAIATLATFILKDAGIHDWKVLVATLPLLIVGGVVCLLWYRLLLSYKILVGFRMQELEAMEEEIPGCHKMYTLESQNLYKLAPKGKKISQSRTEMWLPRVFGGVYIALFLVALLFVFVK